MDSNKSLSIEAQSNNKLYRMAAAIITFAVFTVSMITFALAFDQESRYFTYSPIAISFYFALGTGVLYALSAFIIFKGESVENKGGIACGVFAILSAIGTALSFIYYIYSDLAARITAASAPEGSAEALYSGPEILTVALTVTAILASVYSLSKAFSKSKTLKLFTGYCRVIFFALVITKLYLDFSVELNSPIKLFIQFAAGLAMLSTVSDLRVLIGRAHAPTFVFSKLLAVILASVNLAALTFETLPNLGKYGNEYILYPILLAICGIESAYELFSARFTVATEETEEKSEEATSDCSVEASVDTSAETPDEESVDESDEQSVDRKTEESVDESDEE